MYGFLLDFGVGWLVVAFVLSLGMGPAYEHNDYVQAMHYLAELSMRSDPDVIQEDDPRWDCRTMGNRICG